MLHRLFLTLTLLSALTLLSSASPAANPLTRVNLRIEGADKTIFAGPVLTQGHNVTTPSGGTHPCDGTNNHENPFRGPTCTSTLDDAAKIHRFPFDGTFSTQFDDFFITSIGGESQTDTQFWYILLNFRFIYVGGCQQPVYTDEDVLFAFDAFNKAHILKLTGPGTARVNQAVILTVTDGQNGKPVAGADVDGKISDANGYILITFASAGRKELKARKSDSIRSNQLTIQVTAVFSINMVDQIGPNIG